MRRVEGYIKELDCEKMQAKVILPQQHNIVTNWLQIGFTGPDESFNYKENSYVGCLLDDDLNDGWIICRLYSDKDTPAKEDVWEKRFEDGSIITHNADTSFLSLKVGTSEIKLEKDSISISTETSLINLSKGEIIINTGDGAIFYPIHNQSPCPVFGVCHLIPSTTVSISG